MDLTVGATVDPITAGLTLAGNIVNFTKDELARLNSPEAIAERQAQWEQEQRSLDVQAVTKAQQGDATELEERSS